MRIFVVTGAGISAESGIPTFRGPGGFWRNLDPMKLATESAFRRDPQLVWDWYHERRVMIRKAQPNPAHEAVVRLAREADEFLLLTQNVDDLHARARWNGEGLEREQVVQIHGDIFLTRCLECAYRHPAGDEPETGVPRCPQCGGPLRPGVVWFGEELDPAEIARVEGFLLRGPCDAVIVVGTMAVFGYIVNWSLRARGETGRLIEINPAESELSPYADETIREPAAVALPSLVRRLLSGNA